MFTGQAAVISNQGTWASETYELEDDDGTITDLSAVADLDIVVTVYDGITGSDYGSAGSYCVRATASIGNGKVTVPGSGFQWQFEVSDLSGLCAGTYRLGAKITMDGFVVDEILGTIVVLEGAPDGA